MQNKKEFLDDKVFKDQAWQEMSKLLDQEMPVKRKKRVVPFFFWGTGIAAIVLFVFCMNVPTKLTNSEDYLDSKQEKPSISTEPIASTEIKNIKKTVLEVDRNFDNENKLIQEKSSNISVKKTDNRTKIKSNNRNLSPKLPANISKTTIDIFTPLFVQKEGKKKPSDIDIQNVSVEQINAPIEVVKRNSVLNIQPIKALNIQAINMEQPTELPKIMIHPKAQLLSKFALRTGYGSNFRQQSNYHIGLDWQIGISEKWSFITGLQYRFFPKNRTRNIDNNLLQTEDIVEVGEGASSGMNDIDPMSGNVDFNSGVTISIDPNNYIEYRHALVLPLNIQYQMNKKWSCSAGLRVAYLFQKQNFDESRNFDSMNISTQMLNVSLDDTIEYWSNLGFQFNPIPRWGISLQYNRSWMPLSNAYSGNVSVISTGKNNFNHFWETSVSYHF